MVNAGRSMLGEDRLKRVTLQYLLSISCIRSLQNLLGRCRGRKHYANALKTRQRSIKFYCRTNIP